MNFVPTSSIFVLQDVNECTDGSHKCSHNCSNTVGGYTCSCPIGFQITSDPKMCKGTIFSINNNTWAKIPNTK